MNALHMFPGWKIIIFTSSARALTYTTTTTTTNIDEEKIVNKSWKWFFHHYLSVALLLFGSLSLWFSVQVFAVCTVCMWIPHRVSTIYENWNSPICTQQKVFAFHRFFALIGIYTLLSALYNVLFLLILPGFILSSAFWENDEEVNEPNRINKTVDEEW